jgi:biopolymer transport protein ExbD
MKRFDQINVIPFIDIMLVLLAIVLTTASFISTQNLGLELPEAENTQKDELKDPLLLSISASSQFYLHNELIEKATLQERLKTFPRTTPIVVSVDQSAPFRDFIFLIDILKGLQLENLSIKANKLEKAP